MMSYELKSYQKTAVYDKADGLLANTLRFLNSRTHQRLFVLKAIMGSGKTIIASEFIEAILNSKDPDRTDKELCVIWLSKGNAGLHMQSSEKLKRAIDDKNIHIYGIRESADFNADRFYDKDVYVINWEKINNLKDGKLVNNLFEDSEMKNLPSAKRNSPNVEFIFIIDEFHMNYGTESYKKIVDFFNPHVIIGMSATPSDEQMAKADAKYTIPVAEVIAEGMVKKGICFNTAINYTDDEISACKTIDEFFLRLALRQRDILEKKYQAVRSTVIPLLLIQFNDDKTNEDIIKVKDILDKECDNNRNDVYAIWISETDNKKDKLRSPDHIIQGLDNNTVKILLFKQAVATGWDCPRAQVLLRYRRVTTRKDADSSFDIQTLGRIFRMPEPNKFSEKQYKHYDDEDLNYGYVYTPDNDYKLKKEFQQSFGDDADIFRERVVTVDYEQYGLDIIKKAEALLSTVNVVANDIRPDDQEISRKIKEIFECIDVPIDHREGDSDTGRLVFPGKTMKITDELFESNAKDPIDETGKSVSINENPSVQSDEADKLLADLIDKKQYSKAVKAYMKQQIKLFFKEQIAKCEETDDESIAKISRLIVQNKDIINQMIRETDDAIRGLSGYKFVSAPDAPYKFPKSLKVPSNVVEASNSKGLMHLPLPDTASGPEKIFEKILNRSGNVLLWYKNADHGANAFCVKYEKPYQKRGKTMKDELPTYPDFIVIFKDGRTGIYEIKDYDKYDENNELKEQAIRETVGELTEKGYAATGGLIYIDQQLGNMRYAEKYPEFQEQD